MPTVQTLTPVLARPLHSSLIGIFTLLSSLSLSLSLSLSSSTTKFMKDEFFTACLFSKLSFPQTFILAGFRSEINNRVYLLPAKYVVPKMCSIRRWRKTTLLLKLSFFFLRFDRIRLGHQLSVDGGLGAVHADLSGKSTTGRGFLREIGLKGYNSVFVWPQRIVTTFTDAVKVAPQSCRCWECDVPAAKILILTCTLVEWGGGEGGCVGEVLLLWSLQRLVNTFSATRGTPISPYDGSLPTHDTGGV